MIFSVNEKQKRAKNMTDHKGFEFSRLNDPGEWGVPRERVAARARELARGTKEDWVKAGLGGDYDLARQTLEREERAARGDEPPAPPLPNGTYTRNPPNMAGGGGTSPYYDDFEF